MQLKYIDWRSDRELEEERLSLMYHMNSNHSPHLDVLIRSRMKMLNKLFNQMNTEVTPAKRYYASPRYELAAPELKEHPFACRVLRGMEELGEGGKPFLDYERYHAFGGGALDGPELYLISRHSATGRLELFYCHPAELAVQRLKELDGEAWGKLFDPELVPEAGDGAVFVTANIFRSLKLFGERGYRLCLLEGGRMTERLAACSRHTGAGLQPTLAFYDKEVHKLLGIDGQFEAALSCLIHLKEES